MPDLPNKSINLWMNWHAASLLPAVVLSLGLQTALPVAAIAFISFAVYLWAYLRQAPLPGAAAQLANILTIGRLLALLFVTALICCLPVDVIFAIFLCNLLLDLADGNVARKTGSASYFGAILDQEVDAFYVLAAGLYFYLAAGIGAWILLPGVLRYAYRVVSWALRYAEKDEERQKFLAYFAGLNFVLLTVAIVLPASAQFVVLALTTLFFTASFAVSFWQMFRRA